MRSISSDSAIITLTIGVVSVFQLLPTRQIWALLLLVLFLIPAIILRSTAAIHTILFCFLLVLLPITLPVFRWWPFRLLAPLLAYHVIVLLFPKLRQSYVGFQRGRISKDVLFLILITVVVSTMALIGWYWLIEPDLSIYLGQFPDMPLVAIPFAGLGFALLNAVMEEFAFRGILMHGIRCSFDSFAIANFLQAIAFGFFHFLRGFPNGIIGAAMAFVYGILLGFIRDRSSGMAAPIITHIFADLVIFSILIMFLRFSASRL
jgi:membrane protease YdiL (CAAX protease family)